MSEFHCTHCGKYGVYRGGASGSGAKPDGWVQNKYWGFGIKYFCSNKCMNDYNSYKENQEVQEEEKVSKPNMFERMVTEEDNKRKLEKDKEDIRLNNLTNIQFGTDSNDILEVMNQLVSIVSNNSDLKTKKIVVQKLEYGLLKLNQFGLTNEVEYFTKKLNKIKPKWWEYVIHVLNSK